MSHQQQAVREGFTWICRPYITTKRGQRIYAWQKGKKAFCFWVPAGEVCDISAIAAPAANEEIPMQGELDLRKD